MDLPPSRWLEINGVYDDESLIELAKQYGAIARNRAGESVAKLSPRRISQSSARSFSFHYGYGKFPLHTDTAFWMCPARYVLMRSNDSSCTSTLILDAENTMELFASPSAKNALFGILTNESTFYGSAMLGANRGIRFDPCYMRPANSAAKHLSEQVGKASEKAHAFEWTGANALLIDNWACLHGRNEIGLNDLGRCLSRVYIEERPK